MCVEVINGMADTIADLERKLAELERKLAEKEWIPFTSRPLTEEEKEIYPEWDGIYTCETPKVGQEVLISYRNDVWTDTFFDDYGCGLENYGDIKEGMAWMPLPEPYEGR